MLNKEKTKKLRSKKFICIEKKVKKEEKPDWVGSRPVSFGSMPFDADNIGEHGFYI